MAIRPGKESVPVDDELTRIAKQGRLGDAVLNAFVGMGERAPTIAKLAVRSLPMSGTPAELLGAAAIDAEHIAQAVRQLR
jgi:transketolase